MPIADSPIWSTAHLVKCAGAAQILLAWKFSAKPWDLRGEQNHGWKCSEEEPGAAQVGAGLGGPSSSPAPILPPPQPKQHDHIHLSTRAEKNKWYRFLLKT